MTEPEQDITKFQKPRPYNYRQVGPDALFFCWNCYRCQGEWCKIVDAPSDKDHICDAHNTESEIKLCEIATDAGIMREQLLEEPKYNDLAAKGARIDCSVCKDYFLDSNMPACHRYGIRGTDKKARYAICMQYAPNPEAKKRQDILDAKRREHPEIAKALDEAKAKEATPDPWEGWGAPTTINEIMELRPPIEYAVAGLMSFIDNLVVVYGAPSSFKSFLMQCLALCVAMGKDWLPPAVLDDPELRPVEVQQYPVMWVDGEQGKRRTMDRFQELGFGLNVNRNDCNISLWSMPNPMLDASREESLKKLAARIKATGAKLVFIDCLVTVSGDAEENTADMAPVMYGLKRVGTETGAIMVVIHHSRKQYATNGAKDDEDLRGHSSIKGAADVALLVRREGINSRIASIIRVKGREGEAKTLTAKLEPYTAHDGIRSVQFVQVSQDSQDRATENSVVSAVLDVLRTNGPTVQGKLIDYVQGRLKKGGVHTGKSGEKYVANILKQMAADNKVKVSSGKNRSMIYEIA